MTQLVGIVNITPDSFSDGGQYDSAEAALKRAQELFAEGASLIDVGAESTRPGAIKLTDDDEWQRLEPVLATLMHKYPGRVSLDTYHPRTAERALNLGDVIINDITGMNNPEMVDVVARYNARCIVSQLQGSDVQAAHHGDLQDDERAVLEDLRAKEQLLVQKGLDPENIIFDPGIGFGKTPALNQRLLSFAALMPGKRVMIGYSRKRFLGDKRMELAPNLRAGQIAIAAGASYLRVHDVSGHLQLL